MTKVLFSIIKRTKLPLALVVNIKLYLIFPTSSLVASCALVVIKINADTAMFYFLLHLHELLLMTI